MSMPTGAEMMAHPSNAHFVEEHGMDSLVIQACIREYDALLAGPDGDQVRALHSAGYFCSVIPTDYEWLPIFVAARNAIFGALRAGLMVESLVVDGRLVEPRFDLNYGRGDLPFEQVIRYALGAVEGQS